VTSLHVQVRKFHLDFSDILHVQVRKFNLNFSDILQVQVRKFSLDFNDIPSKYRWESLTWTSMTSLQVQVRKFNLDFNDILQVQMNHYNGDCEFFQMLAEELLTFEFKTFWLLCWHLKKPCQCLFMLLLRLICQHHDHCISMEFQLTVLPVIDSVLLNGELLWSF